MPTPDLSTSTPALRGHARPPRFESLLCVVRSTLGIMAAERAAILAGGAGARLTIVTVSEHERRLSSRPAPGAPRPSELVEPAEARHLEPELVRLPIDERDAAGPLLNEALQRRADLIVVAHERRSLRGRLFGTLSEQLARQGRMPVLVVNRKPEGPYRKVMVAVDFSESSGAAMEQALRLNGGAELKVLHIYDTSYALVLRQATGKAEDIVRYEHAQRDEAEEKLTRFLEPWHRFDVALSPLLNSGDPIREVVRVATRCGADLLVVGQHGFLNTAHSLLGSVSEAALRNARCDVLVAPVAGSKTNAQ